MTRLFIRPSVTEPQSNTWTHTKEHFTRHNGPQFVCIVSSIFRIFLDERVQFAQRQDAVCQRKEPEFAQIFGGENWYVFTLLILHSRQSHKFHSAPTQIFLVRNSESWCPKLPRDLGVHDPKGIASILDLGFICTLPH